MRPAPSQRGQVPDRTIWPRTVRETCWTTPAPPQPGHVTGDVPGAAPEPAQVSQLRAARTLTPSEIPRSASARSISTCAPTSGPRAGRGPALLPCPKSVSPKNAAKTSERLPKSASIGENPPPRKPGVAEAVVGLPALGIREHLVRLGDGAESELGVGLLAHVGVELARQPPERRA